MDCVICGALVVDREDGVCSDTCRWGHIQRRRDAVIAKRDSISSKRTRQVPRKPAWRAAVHHNDGRTVSYCSHRHRDRKAAIECATRMYDYMNDLARAEKWPED